MPNSDVLIQTVMGEFKCTTERNYENDITLKVRDRIDFLKQNIDQIYKQRWRFIFKKTKKIVIRR